MLTKELIDSLPMILGSQNLCHLSISSVIVLLVVGNIHWEEHMPGQGCLAQGRKEMQDYHVTLVQEELLPTAATLWALQVACGTWSYSWVNCSTSKIVLIDSGKALIVEDWQHGNLWGYLEQVQEDGNAQYLECLLNIHAASLLVLLDKCGTLLWA